MEGESGPALAGAASHFRLTDNNWANAYLCTAGV